MLTSLAVISLFTAAVIGQSSTNPFIPTGISDACSSYLTKLNSDTKLTSCISGLTAATSAYGPGSTTSSVTAGSISSTLDSLCSSSINDSCPESTVRSTLSDLYTACSDELTSAVNTDVLKLYDVLYAILPFREAICAKDDSGSYCMLHISSNIAGGDSTSNNNAAVPGAVNVQEVEKYLYYTPGTAAVSRRDTALAPNTTTIRSSNLLFMFLQPNLDASKCTTCTRNVITPYLNFKSDCPYAPGITSSPMLSGLQDLYKGVVDACGNNFISGAVQAAGSLSGGSSSGSSAAFRTVGDFKTAIAVALGVATIGFVSFN